jgi:hypothetical protein
MVITLLQIVMPKKLKYSKKIEEESSAFISLITSYCSKINKEYVKNMTTLIEEIAIGENLDPEMLKNKYLNKKNVKDNIPENDIILDKIEFEGKYYFVEPGEDGTVYNENSTVVGKMVNKSVVFSS